MAVVGYSGSSDWDFRNIGFCTNQKPLRASVGRELLELLGGIESAVPSYELLFTELVKKIAGSGKMRACGTEPEIMHPLRVAKMFKDQVPDAKEWEIIAAVAHDIPEEEMKSRAFPKSTLKYLVACDKQDDIARVVWTLTKNKKDPNYSIHEYRAQLLKSVEDGDQTSVLIKFFDTFDNSKRLTNMKDLAPQKALEYNDHCIMFENAALLLYNSNPERAKILALGANIIRQNCKPHILIN